MGSGLFRPKHEDLVVTFVGLWPSKGNPGGSKDDLKRIRKSLQIVALLRSHVANNPD
eukprot:gene7971-7371_t